MRPVTRRDILHRQASTSRYGDASCPSQEPADQRSPSSRTWNASAPVRSGSWGSGGMNDGQLAFVYLSKHHADKDAYCKKETNQ
jgi:hypothetical protein